MEIHPGDVGLESKPREWRTGSGLSTVHVGADEAHKRGLCVQRQVLEEFGALGSYFINEVSKALLERAILTSKRSHKAKKHDNTKREKINGSYRK